MKRTPDPTSGSEPGSETFIKIWRSRAPKARDMVIKRLSVLAMPTMVLIRIGNTAARMVMMILDTEPKPNSMMISGSRYEPVW